MARAELLEALVLRSRVVLFEVIHLLDPTVVDRVPNRVAVHHVGKVVVTDVTGSRHAKVITETIIGVENELAPAPAVCRAPGDDVMGLVGDDQGARAVAAKGVRKRGAGPLVRCMSVLDTNLTLADGRSRVDDRGDWVTRAHRH